MDPRYDLTQKCKMTALVRHSGIFLLLIFPGQCSLFSPTPFQKLTYAVYFEERSVELNGIFQWHNLFFVLIAVEGDVKFKF